MESRWYILLGWERGAGKPIMMPRGGEGDKSLMRFGIWKCVCVCVCFTVQARCVGQRCLVWTQRGQETRWLFLRHRAAVVWDSANEWTSLHASPWCCSSLSRSQEMPHRETSELSLKNVQENVVGLQKHVWTNNRGKVISPERSTQADLYHVFPQIRPRRLCTVRKYLSVQKKVLHLWLISS